MKEILLWDLGTERDELNEPLGIEMLSGSLRRYVPEVRVQLRWENAVPEHSELDLRSFGLIGIGARPGNLQPLIRILDTIRQLSDPPVVVLGNALATFAYKEMLALFPEAICVLGEGESAIRSLAEAALRRGGITPEVLERIPNLAFVSADEVRVTHRIQEKAAELSSPDRRFLEWVVKRRGIVRVEGSRGCSYSACQFCCVMSKYNSRGWRPFPISDVVNQLATISALGSVGPYFCDEDFFGGNPQRALDLANAILEAKHEGAIDPKMHFFVSARANDIVGPEGRRCLSAMKSAGLREVFVGIESGSSPQLCRYGKKATPDLNKQALATLRELGLETDIGYILFDPEMTFEELRLSAEYLDELDLVEHDARSIKDLRVQPFTGLADKYSSSGMISGQLDLNGLYYPVTYRDERVGWVREKFQEYERPGMESVYRVQASSRGEVESEHYRASAKHLLGKIRKNDLEQLIAYISYAAGEVDRATINQLTDLHAQHRKQLLASIDCHKQAGGTSQESEDLAEAQDTV